MSKKSSVAKLVLALTITTAVGLAAFTDRRAEAQSVNVRTGYICSVSIGANRLDFSLYSDYGCQGSNFGTYWIWQKGAGAPFEWSPEMFMYFANKLMDNRWSKLEVHSSSTSSNLPFRIGFINN